MLKWLSLVSTRHATDAVAGEEIGASCFKLIFPCKLCCHLRTVLIYCIPPFTLFYISCIIFFFPCVDTTGEHRCHSDQSHRTVAQVLWDSYALLCTLFDACELGLKHEFTFWEVRGVCEHLMIFRLYSSVTKFTCRLITHGSVRIEYVHLNTSNLN